MEDYVFKTKMSQGSSAGMLRTKSNVVLRNVEILDHLLAVVTSGVRSSELRRLRDCLSVSPCPPQFSSDPRDGSLAVPG